MSGNPHTDEPWDTDRRHRRQQRERIRRWAIMAAAGTAAVGLVAAVGYAVTGSSEPKSSRPVAASSTDPSDQPIAPDAATKQKPAAEKAPKKHKKPKAHHSPHKRPNSAPKPDAPSGGGKTGSYAQQVLSLTNAQRAKAGCGPVTYDARLQRAAQKHSDDMAIRNFFDHKNPDGKTPGDRITAAGYPWSTFGENIAAGQPTPSAVMTAWMTSPGHRANILNCRFKNLGVGVATRSGSKFRIYWTQDFGTLR